MVGLAGPGRDLQQHVGGLDVPVDQPAGVRRVQRGRGLGDQRAGPGGRQRAHPVDQRPHVAAGDVAHGDVQHTVGLPGAEHRNDVRVLGGRRYAGLLDEPRPEYLVAGEVGGQHLQGHPPVEVVVVGAVDHGHAAPADLLLDPVARQLRAGSEPARQRGEFLAHRSSSGARRGRCGQAHTAGGRMGCGVGWGNSRGRKTVSAARSRRCQTCPAAPARPVAKAARHSAAGARPAPTRFRYVHRNV